jgi:RecA/RadA recombinase
MVARKKAKRSGGDYFPPERRSFIPTGCTLLDCVLGGGWVLGRVSNIVGDKSTGKTLLAIEACANFARTYPDGKIYYREAESAFDEGYARRLGLPADRVDFGPQGTDTAWRTIEKIFSDLREICDAHAIDDGEGGAKRKKKGKVTPDDEEEEDTTAKKKKREKKVNPLAGKPALYIIDSLDAVSSEAALSRDVGEGSYNLEKQKILAQLFEQLVSEFKAAKMCILIVSQTRDKIGYVVGDKHRRNGGKSLDFYSSHILWLAHIKTLTRTMGGEKRATGIRVLAHAKKNKVSVPFGKCEFPIRFGYGIDDVEASLNWLASVKMTKRLGIKPDEINDYMDDMEELPAPEFAKRAQQIRETTIQAWAEIEERFAPTRSKYT